MALLQQGRSAFKYCKQQFVLRPGWGAETAGFRRGVFREMGGRVVARGSGAWYNAGEHWGSPAGQGGGLKICGRYGRGTDWRRDRI